ncbi:MAG: N-acetyltransferase, partial [Phenylobacterium sp.]|nr:N-acetyltransferase [Phenylobacterium sp.]
MKVKLAPILETDRLILRAPVAEDFEAWAAFAADEETMRHLGGPQARSVAWR